MQPFCANFYVVKGKVVQITTATGKGFEEDAEVESYETEISHYLESILAGMKEIKQNKKVIFFGEIENARWLKTEKRFKEQPVIKLKKSQLTNAEFKWMDKTRKSFDEKNSLTSTPAHVEFILERI